MWLLWFQTPAQTMSRLWKEVYSVWKDQSLQKGLQKWEEQKDAHHQPKTDQYQKEDDIDMVNINSIIFNSKSSVITANLKTPSNQARVIVLCKIDTGSNAFTHLQKNYSQGPQKNN